MAVNAASASRSMAKLCCPPNIASYIRATLALSGSVPAGRPSPADTTTPLPVKDLGAPSYSDLTAWRGARPRHARRPGPTRKGTTLRNEARGHPHDLPTGVQPVV